MIELKFNLWGSHCHRLRITALGKSARAISYGTPNKLANAATLTNTTNSGSAQKHTFAETHCRHRVIRLN